MVTAISGWNRLRRLSDDTSHIDCRHQTGQLIKTLESSVIVTLYDVLRWLCAKTICSHELPLSRFKGLLLLVPEDGGNWMYDFF